MPKYVTTSITTTVCFKNVPFQRELHSSECYSTLRYWDRFFDCLSVRPSVCNALELWINRDFYAESYVFALHAKPEIWLGCQKEAWKCSQPFFHRILLCIEGDMKPASPCLGGAVGSVAVRAAWLRWSASLGSRPRLERSLCQVIAAYALRLNSRAARGRHREFDGVLFNLWPLTNTGFRDAQY